MLSPTKAGMFFLFFFSVVHNSGQLDMDNTKHLISFIRNPGRFKDVCLTSFYTSHCPPLIHSVLCPVTCRYILATNRHPSVVFNGQANSQKGPAKIISLFSLSSKRQRFFSSTFWPRACPAGYTHVCNRVKKAASPWKATLQSPGNHKKQLKVLMELQ